MIYPSHPIKHTTNCFVSRNLSHIESRHKILHYITHYYTTLHTTRYTKNNNHRIITPNTLPYETKTTKTNQNQSGSVSTRPYPPP